MKKTSFSRIACALAAVLALGACSGSDGSAGATGPQGPAGANGANGATGATGAAGANGQDLTATAKAESCAMCHNGAGAQHQAVYNTYKDQSAFAVTIDDVASVLNGDGVTYTSTLTFTVTKDNQPYVDAGLAGLEQKKYAATTFDSATGKFNATFDYSSPTATAVPGQYTVKNTAAAFAPEQTNAQVYVYVVDDKITTEGMQLYSNVKNVGKVYGDAGSYASTATVSGCEKCHGAPYMKHGYRGAAVAGLADFAACKACHYDTRNGGHQAWQLLADDPAAFAAQNGVPTAEQKALYPYKATVMNDTHMSHAMEFAYPQSMANCTTCHEGKLDRVLTDANFTLATCKSCHPVTGTNGDPKRAPALNTLMKSGALAQIHIMDLYTYTGSCNACHTSAQGGIAKSFSQIHTGFSSTIYPGTDGKKYSDYFKVAIDDASVANDVLTIKFSATETGDVAGLAVTDITPTVMVGLYGYDTKDFIVAAHGSAADGKRNLEYVVGTVHPRFTTVAAANGQWEVTADLSNWADLIADGTVKRAELVVMPKLQKDGATVALNAVTKTFSLATNGFVESPRAIVNADKCNKCHDALGTTFHSGDRGGSVVTCRICHTVRDGGSHLEMQSRSIDSYVHAIHSFQPFDVKSIDFSDPVASMRYDHHVESGYPNFTITNCESCHEAGTYEVPDQSKSLPGVLSASAVNATWDRSIGTVPSYVTGPASRACGSCHRAQFINENNAGELAAFNAHTAAFGTQLENGTGVLDAAITKIMSLFK